MALTQALKEIYTHHDEKRRHYDTVQFYHPNFGGYNTDAYPSETSYPSVTSYPSDLDIVSQSRFLVQNTENMTFNIEDGSTQIFIAFPFKLMLPEAGSDQQDIGVVLDNVSLELINEIESASLNTEVPIKMIYRVYIDGSTYAQNTPIELSITNLSVDMNSITATATRANLYDRRFPFGETTVYDRRFKGLYL